MDDNAEDIDFDFFDSPGRSDEDDLQNKGHHDSNGVTSGEKAKSKNPTNINNMNTAVSSNRDDSTGGRNAAADTNGNNKSSFLADLVPSSNDSSASDDDDTVDFRVTVTGHSAIHSINDARSDINYSKRASSPKGNLKSKPPLPVAEKSAWKDQSKSDKRRARQLAIEAQPDYDAISNAASLITPGSTFYTADGRKMRKGRCRYSDKELTDSDSSSEELETVCRNRRRRPPQDSQLKIKVKDLSTRQSGSGSGSDRSRSRSNSSNWSTGSERNRSGRKSRTDDVQRPGTRLSHRRSSSSGSSITVSSLSADEDGPESKSRDIGSPKPLRIDHSDTVDKDRMNLEILLSALLEDDRQAGNEGRRRADGNPSLPQKRAAKSKSNYTFTNNEAKMIDLENQRLLNNILSQRASAGQGRVEGRGPTASTSTSAPKSNKKSYVHREPPRRVTNATVNRMRDQQRIERENLAMLRRLNKIQPSAELNRTKNLDDYHRQISYYCPELRGMPSDIGNISTQRSRSSMSAGEGHASSVQGGRKGRPLSASSNSNRPSSAYTGTPTKTTRPSSATTRRPVSATLRKRPEWQSGW